MGDPKKEKRYLINTVNGVRMFTLGDRTKPDLSPEQEAETKRKMEANRSENEAKWKAAFEKDGMEIRMKVLRSSLYVEETVMQILQFLIGPKLSDLGLMFSKHIQLLDASGMIEPEEHKLLKTFSEVRNKFIHYKEINSYVACYAQLTAQREVVLDIAQDKVEKMDFTVTGTEEETLGYATNVLAERVDQICDAVAEKLKDRIREPLLARVFLRIQDGIQTDNGPFASVASTIYGDQKTTYTKEEVIALVEKVAHEVGQFITKVGYEERDKFVKEERPRRDPFYVAPPASTQEPSTPQA